MRLDNLSLKKTPAAVIGGTDCLEPGAAGAAAVATFTTGGPAGPPTPTAALVTGGSTAAPAASVSTPAWGGSAVDAGWIAMAAGPRGELAAWMPVIDLREVTDARLSLGSWLTAFGSAASVQVSTDGVTWQVVKALGAADGSMDVDLSPFAGQVVWVRVVFEAVGAPPRPFAVQ